jgi:hypothetical protein
MKNGTFQWVQSHSLVYFLILSWWLTTLHIHHNSSFHCCNNVHISSVNLD